MASPSCSFSTLLNSLTACGLSSGYPGQVEGWVFKCTKKAYHFNEKQKAYLEAKFAIGQTTGKKLDGDILSREMRHALGPISGQAKKKTTLLDQGKLSWPLHSSIPSLLNSTIFAAWPRVITRPIKTKHATKHLSETGIRGATQAYSP